MPNKMERFTQRARRVLSLAQEEAELLQSGYIGPEHILLGLIQEGEGVAATVLRDFHIEFDKVSELVSKLPKPMTRFDAPLDLSPLTKKMLELSVEEARRMGHDYIGTEHLLLALVRLSDNPTTTILAQLNVSAEEIRRQTRRVLQENAPAAESGSAEWVSPVPVPRARSILRGDFGRAIPGPTAERMRILDMVEQGKISADEGAKLLGALQLTTPVIAGIPQAMMSTMFKWSGGDKRHLRLRITDKATGDLKAELNVSGEQFESGIAALVEAIFKTKTGKVAELDDDPNLHIELFIDEDQPDAPPSE